MSSMSITMIVPRLPPSIDGLGDYGFHLAKQLKNEFNINVEFIIGDAKWNGPSEIEGFKIKKVSERNTSALLSLLPANQIVLLNYVGYGYAKRGSPVWLVKALHTWKKDPRNKLITMFHELYAFGPVWTSQFWTSPLQRHLCAKLCLLSDISITSKTQYAEKISKFSNGKHPNVPVFPIFSNVGEPPAPSELAKRPRKLVIFGGKGPRARVYNSALIALEKICRELDIKEIIDLGPSLDFQIPSVNGMTVHCLGTKSSEEVSSILSECVVGFFNYPTGYLAKSGIFAAYCAHRLLPAGISWEGQEIDGVTPGEQYIEVDKLKDIDLVFAQKVADNAHSWYAGHSLNTQGMIFFKIISGIHLE